MRTGFSHIMIRHPCHLPSHSLYLGIMISCLHYVVNIIFITTFCFIHCLVSLSLHRSPLPFSKDVWYNDKKLFFFFFKSRQLAQWWISLMESLIWWPRAALSFSIISLPARDPGLPFRHGLVLCGLFAPCALPCPCDGAAWGAFCFSERSQQVWN